MLRLILKVFIVLFFYQLPALSKDYDEILIKGNERISDDTILVFADIPTEKFLDENLLDSILKKIYDSGFFSDVIVKINGGDLIIQVKENPIIQTLFINGIKTKKIKEKIDSVIVLKDRSSFNITLVKNDEVAILNLLKEMGYYFSTLTSSIEELKDNKVNLNYNIVLGDNFKNFFFR